MLFPHACDCFQDLDERKCTNGELDLDDLEEGSSLEVLAFLGRVREVGAFQSLPQSSSFLQCNALFGSLAA